MNKKQVSGTGDVILTGKHRRMRTGTFQRAR